ncbi:hypothetical protein SAMN05421676_108133 [Salinibacillus kushneri]|uniref:Uncharacterized protein n=1 Tax=Salinibacillus kushneri TaxID=237682 RepID=A0A1I0HAT2_9BACI|nr:hypothetical protein [Salinibacillus kushneri]SET80737.1 hypothetical protein SAMN05421676_108133 [Salinibacillus kushneri]
MEEDFRKKYTEEHIKEVKSIELGNLRVYFDNEEWFKYSKDGSWKRIMNIDKAFGKTKAIYEQEVE